jgi:type II secretory pathway pseudopilin PulG
VNPELPPSLAPSITESSSDGFAPISEASRSQRIGMRPSPGLFAARRQPGFTLIEVVVVITIIIAMMVVMGPAITGLKGSSDMNQAAADIAGMVQISRSYAISHNTYVYMGIDEFDASQPENGPQIEAGNTKGGRVAMVAIASRDGTRGYSPYATTMTEVASGDNSWQSNFTSTRGLKFVTISKLKVFENLHLFDYGTLPPPTSGNMARPYVSASYLRLGNSSSTSVTPIQYPLGATSGGHTAYYKFTKVLQFDPEGLMRIAPSGAPTTYSAQGVPEWIELAFIQTHGSIVPKTTSMFTSGASESKGNHVCLQIDGMKATARTFRP